MYEHLSIDTFRSWVFMVFCYGHIRYFILIVTAVAFLKCLFSFSQIHKCGGRIIIGK